MKLQVEIIKAPERSANRFASVWSKASSIKDVHIHQHNAFQIFKFKHKYRSRDRYAQQYCVSFIDILYRGVCLPDCLETIAKPRDTGSN